MGLEVKQLGVGVCERGRWLTKNSNMSYVYSVTKTLRRAHTEIPFLCKSEMEPTCRVDSRPDGKGAPPRAGGLSGLRRCSASHRGGEDCQTSLNGTLRTITFNCMEFKKQLFILTFEFWTDTSVIILRFCLRE